MTEKKSTSFRLTGETLELIRTLSESRGISQAAYLEILVREDAKATVLKGVGAFRAWLGNQTPEVREEIREMAKSEKR